MMDRLKLTGLTKTQAEQCLDWLQNQGYSGCQAELHGERWSIVLGTASPASTGGASQRTAKVVRASAAPLTNRLPASGS